jgi:amidase
MASTQIAFVPDTRVARARLHEGALSGLTFAAKDLFAIRGHVSSAGVPDWARTHLPADQHASVIEQLLREGADLVGVTILDELAFGLSGVNMHYGTPPNPRVPDRLCGGSSCGSAAAVAGALCDFALGTDTAGSVRIPAAFCGLFGMRCTQGAISTEGVVPLAPSFDTVGFFTRDPHTFVSVGSVLFGDAAPAAKTSAAEHDRAQPRRIERVLIAEDALALCDAGVPELLHDLLDRINKSLSVRVDTVEVAPEGLATLAASFARLRNREIWHTHGAWIEKVQPTLSEAVAARFQAAREQSADESTLASDLSLRRQVQARVRDALTPGTLLFLPPAPGIAPLLDAAGAELEKFRARALELSCIAALAGAPQLVVPARELDGAPLALSFMAAPGSDAWLSALAAPLDRALGG